ncbi:MAG: reverse transcriptase/maturase family protein [Bacteroidales bacterium]|nr:reverse transcriptase/maturase family protein [Bacteroidales bacterium]
MKKQDLFEENEKNKISLDLFQAYFDARKNKRNTINALAFEKYAEANIFALFNEIIEFDYEPYPSICFIVDKPVKREIFAADFRDRLVHHFIFNYISPVFEKLFIIDSYSCRLAKGVHYGVSRVNHFIKSCSNNYYGECYILKLDILGYFMAINKDLLFDKIKQVLSADNKIVEFNVNLLIYLIEKTIFNDPRKNCIVKGSRDSWKGLPKTKSLFYVQENCGLPIGNLTSQLFANIYMNDFDHWVKNDLGIKYYGRYVDDFILIHENKHYLQSLIPKISDFLSSNLKLTLHPNKIYLQHYSKGVKFLGTVIKPHRIYIANRTKGNFYDAIEKQNKIIKDHKPSLEEQKVFQSCINSYLGIMKHYKTYKIRKNYLLKYVNANWWNYFYMSGGFEKFVFKRKIQNKKALRFKQNYSF